MFSILFSVIAPVALCVLIGFTWGRSAVPYDTAFVTRLITWIGAPCLIIASINDSALSMEVFLGMAGLTAAIMTAAAVLALAVFRLAGMDARSLATTVIFPNAGNMGLSLCYFAFGGDGLALALIVFTVMALTQYATADLILSREKSLARRLSRLASQPLVYAAVVAMVLIATGWQLPLVVGRTLELLGGVTIPLMLLTLGVSLARIGAGDWWQGIVIALTRLLGGALIGFTVVGLFGITGVAAQVLVLQSAMPSAVFNYLLALKYDRHPGAVASGVVVSTVLSAVTLPVLLWLLL